MSNVHGMVRSAYTFDTDAVSNETALDTGVESKFYSEGALGELNPTLKTVLDILKGISSVRGR